MFILTRISDLVQIEPKDFGKPVAELIEDALNRKYANRVIQKIGLAIAVYDILDIGDGLFGHGTGLANTHVEFRLMVFRPFKGEILVGKIMSSTEEGIKISMDFFSDIVVPPGLLFEDTAFDVREQVFTWHHESGDLFFDKHVWVRFRVESENWKDISPVGPASKDDAPTSERQVAYEIVGSMNQAGLGPAEWW